MVYGKAMSATKELQPSSLSLAERLAFFTSLSEGSNVSGGAWFRSRTSSYCKSPTIDRTPRSSTTASSASVTPTPMECSPIPHEVEEESMTTETPEPTPEHHQHNGFHELSRSATAPTPGQEQDFTPTSIRTVRIRTVGKLIMPSTFLGDRNNNNKMGNRNSCQGRVETLEEIKVTLGVRTIGRIKSRFIEQQQLPPQPATSTPNTEPLKLESDSGSDSGKENCASNQQQQQQPQQHPPQQQEEAGDRAPQKVSEMRRKITRLVQGQQHLPAQPVSRRHTTEITAAPAPRPPSVNEHLAKYFGVQKETYNSTTTLLKTRSLPVSQATNELVRLPSITVVQKRRELLKRTRPISLDTNYSSGSISPTSMPSPKRAHSPHNRVKATISCYDDIVVTPAELHAAGQDFSRLCQETLG